MLFVELIVVIVAVLLVVRINSSSPLPAPTLTDTITTLPSETKTITTTAPADFQTPLDSPSKRVTKKMFGTYVTPQNSPVQPERFIGYHTGVDFESFPDEQNTDVQVRAVCSGRVSLNEYASGYGGVMVESCETSIGVVSVVYGHLRLSSITLNYGDTIKIG